MSLSLNYTESEFKTLVEHLRSRWSCFETTLIPICEMTLHDVMFTQDSFHIRNLIQHIEVLSHLRNILRAMYTSVYLDNSTADFLLEVFRAVVRLPQIWVIHNRLFHKIYSLVTLRQFSEAQSDIWYKKNIVEWIKDERNIQQPRLTSPLSPPSREPDTISTAPNIHRNKFIVESQDVVFFTATCAGFYTCSAVRTGMLSESCQEALNGNNFTLSMLEKFKMTFFQYYTAYRIAKHIDPDAKPITADLITYAAVIAEIIHTAPGWKLRGCFAFTLQTLFKNTLIAPKVYEQWYTLNVRDWNPRDNLPI